MAPPTDQLADLAEMTGGFVHDLKNHLGTVLLNLQILAEDFDDPQTQRDRRIKDRVGLMTAECQTLLDLANDFLRFARVDELHRSPVPLDRVVCRLIDFLAPTAKAQNIAVEWFPDADLPAADIDAEMIERAVLNLMLNAEDAMPDGGRLTLTATAAGPDVLLNVIDTGCGTRPRICRSCSARSAPPSPAGTGWGWRRPGRSSGRTAGTSPSRANPAGGPSLLFVCLRPDNPVRSAGRPTGNRLLSLHPAPTRFTFQSRSDRRTTQQLRATPATAAGRRGQDMANFNKVVLIGRLTRDPETPDGSRQRRDGQRSSGSPSPTGGRTARPGSGKTSRCSSTARRSTAASSAKRPTYVRDRCRKGSRR